jgi:hypothetical protein
LLLVTVVWERDSVGVVFLFWFGLVNTLSPQGKLKSSAAQTTIIREGEKGNPISCMLNHTNGNTKTLILRFIALKTKINTAEIKFTISKFDAVLIVIVGLDCPC